MKPTRLFPAVAAICVFVTATAGLAADRETFVAVDTSALLGSPEPPPIAEAVVAFPHLRFEFPVDIAHAGDGSNRLFVVGQNGRVEVFENKPDVQEKKVFLDLRHRVAREFFEEGLLSIAFHPRYRDNGELFVYYSVKPLATRVSRLRVSADDPDRVDPESEEVLLEIPQPFWNHNSGSVRFGHDGYLYIGVGDGGDADDPHGNGQNPRSLLGSVLRIDVDRRDEGLAYAVPPDNPFVGLGDRARPEIWALGLRNPWKMCFDRDTGALWLADVGQDLWEEVNVIVRGGNYGWRVREGAHPFDPTTKPFSDRLIDPVWEYHHSEGRSITGGAVYRGDRLPELRGWYLCADWLSGNIWGLRSDGKRITEARRIVPRILGISAFGEDEAGEVYFTAFDQIAPIRTDDTVHGRIYRLRRPPATDVDVAAFPRKLSETGLFASVESHTPAPGLIPYDVNVPLWSDGAGKDRYLALPAAGRVVFDRHGNWQFPVGTVIVKTFTLETADAAPGSARRLETRLMVHAPAGWVGYTYVWNDEQTDATLLDGYLERDYHVRTAAGPRRQTWYFPSRTDCMTCHTEVRGHVLGLNTRQLNRAGGERRENQLARLQRLGVFSRPLPSDPYALDAFPDWHDDGASPETLARAYLDVNCAFCHAPGGTGMTWIDLDYHTPLRGTRLLPGDRAHATAAGDPSPIVPANPGDSMLLQRLTTRIVRRTPNAPRPPNQMPPLATRIPDRRAIEVMRRWIEGMAGK